MADQELFPRTRAPGALDDPTLLDAAKTVAFSVRRPGPPAAHYLTAVEGARLPAPVAVGLVPLVIGRDPAHRLHLDGAGVSRSHCEVRLESGHLVVRDLGSTNGTFVDGERVAGAVVLPPSSLLQVGEHTLRHDLLTAEEVERERSLAEDLERARRYVAGLIPAPLSDGPVRTEWCFVPSSILGGDALGYHALDDGRIALYLVDVCGHGVDSAMHSASVLNVLRAHTLPDTDFGEPGRVLAALNRAFPMEQHAGMFFTAWYGVLDPARSRLRFASAGHPPALALAPDGTARRLSTANPPVGALGPRPFAQEEAGFAPGERLYVYSDGAFELGTADAGLDDFLRRLSDPRSDRSAGEPERLYRASLERNGGRLLDDDFTLLVATSEAWTSRS